MGVTDCYKRKFTKGWETRAQPLPITRKNKKIYERYKVMRILSTSSPKNKWYIHIETSRVIKNFSISHDVHTPSLPKCRNSFTQKKRNESTKLKKGGVLIRNIFFPARMEEIWCWFFSISSKEGRRRRKWEQNHSCIHNNIRASNDYVMNATLLRKLIINQKNNTKDKSEFKNEVVVW